MAEPTYMEQVKAVRELPRGLSFSDAKRAVDAARARFQGNLELGVLWVHASQFALMVHGDRDAWNTHWALRRYADEIYDEEFRATGFTGDARNHPHTERGFLWLCRFNGIPPEKAPRTWRYASNAGMRDYIDRRAQQDG